MAVFDGSVKTQRRITDPVTDKRITSVASLILPAINTPAALLYPGSDVSVVNGIQHLQVSNDRIMRIGMNQDVAIGMNELYLVDMNRTMTVMQNYSRSVMMNSMINVTGDYSKNVLSNYSKNVTGNSINAITGSYWKTVSTNYSKSVTGNADNQITGNYSKKVQATYTKSVTGTAATTVQGDYSKNLLANYSKAVTGISTIKVTGTSNENYTGDHSRLYASNHKTYIVGDDNHTTLGSTLWSKVGPKVFGQSGPHQQQHDDARQEDSEDWFKHTWKEGIAVGEQIELVGFGQCFTNNKIEVAGTVFDGTIAKLELGSISHAYKISRNQAHLIMSEEDIAKEELVATIKEETKLLHTSVEGLKNDTAALLTDTAAMHEEIGALAERVEPVNLFVGVLFGGNQFAM